jgi:hypothetical protein
MASFWILFPELMTGAKKKPKSPGLIIWLLVFWPLEARGWGILTWSHSRRVSWVIHCSYMFLEEMREMIPIVVGMTEPLPCERVSSFLGKSSLMHSVRWIWSLHLFLLEWRANWNVLEIPNDFFGACVSAFFSIFFYDVGLLEVEKSFILHMVFMVFLLCSYGEPSYVIKWIC